jgi:hypothetical protein
MFATNKERVNTLPVDTHSMVAMVAPRGLLVLDNSRIGELCSTCQHAATAAGAQVFEALGVGKNVAYNGGNPGDPHEHCRFYEATQGEPLRRAIRAHLTKTAAADGRMEPQPARYRRSRPVDPVERAQPGGRPELGFSAGHEVARER